MTTTVIVKNGGPNAVRANGTTLAAGEDKDFYVYPGQEIVVTEIAPREPSADEQTLEKIRELLNAVTS